MILIKFKTKTKTNKKSQNNLTDKSGILFSNYAWSLMEFVNRNQYKELDGKSDSFQEGFRCAIEALREELIRTSGAD